MRVLMFDIDTLRSDHLAATAMAEILPLRLILSQKKACVLRITIVPTRRVCRRAPR